VKYGAFVLFRMRITFIKVSSMRRISLLLCFLLLSACTAEVSQGLDGEAEYGMRFFGDVRAPAVPVTGTFFGKFATTSAVNSSRTFAADYYGDIKITIDADRKITCTWSVEGRMHDAEVGGLLSAASRVCTGKLQDDGTFSFRGTYEGAADDVKFGSGEVLEDSFPTFELSGMADGESVEGDVLLGGVFVSEDKQHPELQDAGAAFFIVPMK